MGSQLAQIGHTFKFPLSEILDLLLNNASVLLCRLGTESDGSHADERANSSSNLHDKLGRLAYHVTHKLADVITRLSDWQRTLDDMLQVSDVIT